MNDDHGNFFTQKTPPQRLLDFLKDLVDVTTFNVSDVSGLSNIPPHEISDILMARGVQPISPGVFNYQAAVAALCDDCDKKRHQLRLPATTEESLVAAEQISSEFCQCMTPEVANKKFPMFCLLCSKTLNRHALVVVRSCQDAVS